MQNRLSKSKSGADEFSSVINTAYQAPVANIQDGENMIVRDCVGAPSTAINSKVCLHAGVKHFFVLFIKTSGYFEQVQKKVIKIHLV